MIVNMLQIKNPSFSLMTDIVFKIVFSNPHAPEIPIAFLNAVLAHRKDKITKIQILNPFSKMELLTDKLSVLDLKVTDQAGHIFNIEVQLKGHGFLRQRFLYYHYRLFSEQLGSGVDYSKLKPAISIYLLGHNHLEDPGFHNIYTMLNTKIHSAYSDSSEMHFLEFAKYDQNLGSIAEGSLDKWARAFLFSDRYCTDEGSLPQDLQKEAEIMTAINLIKQANSDEETKHLIDLRHKSLSDFNSSTAEARKEGFQLGEKRGILLGEKRGFQLGEGQGRIEGKLSTYLNLYQEGTMDSVAARSKMESLLGSGFDDLVKSYLEKLR